MPRFTVGGTQKSRISPAGVITALGHSETIMELRLNRPCASHITHQLATVKIRIKRLNSRYEVQTFLCSTSWLLTAAHRIPTVRTLGRSRTATSANKVLTDLAAKIIAT